MKKLFVTTLLILGSFLGFANGIPYNNKLVLTELNGKKIDTRNVYLAIEKDSKTIVGRSGCNSFNINYKDYGNDKCIKIGEGITTLMGCDEITMQLEQNFNQTLHNRKVRIVEKNNVVYFKNWIGRTIAKFEKQTPESALKFIASHDWKLYQLNHVGMDYGKASIKFDMENMRVSGNSGCNNFMGTFTLSGDTITFSQMGSTKMACMDEQANKTETELLQLLSQGEFRFDTADQTLNLYKDNKLVIMYGITK